jgi:uncharacterized membrane protein
MIRNIKKIFLILIVAVLCFSTNLFAVEYNIENYKIDATVNNDGSIDVVEYLKYYFGESMNGVYRDILYKYTFTGQKNDMEATSSRYQASGIDNISVYTSDTSFENMIPASLEQEVYLSNGMSNVYSVTNYASNGYRERVKVYSPVNEGKNKYIKYEYTIKDAIVNYNDYAELYWNFVGGDWECSINNLDINVYFKDVTDIKAFGNTYAKINSLDTTGNKINMKVSNIYAGTAVDIRGVFPNTYMQNISKNINENYDFSKLTSIKEKAIKDKEKYDLSNKIWVVYGLLNIIAFIYIICKVVECANKNIKTYKKVEHYTELPDEYSLGEYNCIRNRVYGYTDPNLIVATILDLANRKYIKLESLKKAKLFKDTYEYYVSVDTSKKLSELNDYEKEILNYIFNKKMSKEIDLEDFEDNRFELNERFEKIGLNYTLGAKYRKSCTDKTSENVKKMYNPVPKSLWKAYSNIIIMLLIVATINIFGISPIIDKFSMFVPVIMIGAFMFIILAVIIANGAKSLKDEYVDSYNKLLGLQKYLNEYSLIKERYPIELVLWEKYLVFASLFGIADKVAKEFKEELLKQGYDENYIYTTYPIIHMGINSHSFTSSVASMSGSSSSGGYSGGGGGGGGRRWRWRRSLLANKISLNKNSNILSN